jgi:hypothetical protein
MSLGWGRQAPVVKTRDKAAESGKWKQWISRIKEGVEEGRNLKPESGAQNYLPYSKSRCKGPEATWWGQVTLRGMVWLE